MINVFRISVLLLTLFACASCSKGHRVRVNNYYFETLDSVIIGKPEHVFTNIKLGETTAYQGISSGEHSVKCVTADGATFWGTAKLTKSDEGDFTVQVDGLKTIVVLKD